MDDKPKPVAAPRVLWVDDQYEEGAMLLLTLEGFTVDGAATVSTGFAMASAHTYDGIVIDLRLPDGSGLTLLEMLRAHAVCVPVMLLTGFGDIESAISAMRLGAIDYRRKPLVGDEWVDSVRRLVASDGATFHAAKPPVRPLARESHHFGSFVSLLSALKDEPAQTPVENVIISLARGVADSALRDAEYVGCAEALRRSVRVFAADAPGNGLAAEAVRIVTECVRHIDIDRHATVGDALTSIRCALGAGQRPTVDLIASQLKTNAADLSQLLLVTTTRTFDRN